MGNPLLLRLRGSVDGISPGFAHGVDAIGDPFEVLLNRYWHVRKDGRAQSGTAQNWWRLTPDNTGSYSCGTWTKLASIPNSFGYGPNFYASAVLPDGRLGIAGGEYNQGGPQSEIAKAAIYLPTTNQWLPLRPPAGWTQIG